MKKIIISLAAAVAITFGFTACEGIDENLADEITGNIKLTVTETTPGINPNATQPLAVGDSVNFRSVICDAVSQEPYTNPEGETIQLPTTTVFLGTTNNILTENAENIHLTMPFFGANIRGIQAGSYSMQFKCKDTEFISYLYEVGWANLVDPSRELLATINDSLGSVLIIAINANDYYICYEGSMNISKYGNSGDKVTGTINTTAAYITASQLNTIHNLTPEAQAAIKMNYFPSVKLQGSIDSRRTTISQLREALKEFQIDENDININK